MTAPDARPERAEDQPPCYECGGPVALFKGPTAVPQGKLSVTIEDERWQCTQCEPGGHYTHQQAMRRDHKIRLAVRAAWEKAESRLREVEAERDANHADYLAKVRDNLALRAERDALVELVRDVARSGVALEDVRLDYVEIQLDKDTWAAARALLARREKEGA